MPGDDGEASLDAFILPIRDSFGLPAPGTPRPCMRSPDLSRRNLRDGAQLGLRLFENLTLRNTSKHVTWIPSEFGH